MTTIAADAFTRTGSGGWGTADTGGAWAHNNTAPYSTNGSRGVVSVNAGSTPTARLGSVSSTTADLTLSLGVSALPVGGSVYNYVHPRSLAEPYGAPTAYGALVVIAADGTVSLYLVINGTASLLTATGLTMTAAQRLNVHVRVTGTSPTRIQARVWKAGTTEPTAWQIDTTDSTSGLQVAGGIGLRNFVSSAATNAPIAVSYDDLTVTDGTTANVLPTVSAGTDQTAPAGQTVTLSGTASDSDGTIASRSWSCTSFPAGGSAPTLTGASTSTATFTAPSTAGNYVLQFSATDNSGGTSTDSATVTVQPAASPPVISATATTGLAVIDATGSTGTGSLTFSCSPAPVHQDGGYFVVAQTTSAQTFRITVTDSNNLSTSTTVQVPALLTLGTVNLSPIVLTLPIPLDPASEDVWGGLLDTAFDQLRDAGNAMIDAYNNANA